MLKRISEINSERKLNAVYVIVILLLASNIYFAYQHFLLKEKVIDVNTFTEELSQKNLIAETKISDLETIIISMQEENLTFAEIIAKAEEKSERLLDEFDEVNRNVQDLEKLAKTDPELLRKYSKNYFLNENYHPTNLIKIPTKYTFLKNRDYQIREDVWNYLQDLMDDAKDDGMDLQIISAFRSFGEQSILKGAYVNIYGAGTANQFSAEQGFSEHQLGTTIDFTTTKVGSTYSGFSNTEEFKWLKDNAYKYGFILSYPENNSFYQYEPWHWRFVGRKLARSLDRSEKSFYELSQREIDEYLINLFD